MGSSAAVLGAGYGIDSLMLRYQGVDWRDKAHWSCNAGWGAGRGGGVGSGRGASGGTDSCRSDFWNSIAATLPPPDAPARTTALTSQRPVPPHPCPYRSINPYAEHMYDGTNLSPFEVLFVKVRRARTRYALLEEQSVATNWSCSTHCTAPVPQVKEFLLEAHWTTASAAKKYGAWMRHQVPTGRPLLQGDRGGPLACVCVHMPQGVWGAGGGRGGAPPSSPSNLRLPPYPAPAPAPALPWVDVAIVLLLQTNLTSNEYTARKAELRAGMITSMRARGGCAATRHTPRSQLQLCPCWKPCPAAPPPHPRTATRRCCCC